jgi:hypothetical protein
MTPTLFIADGRLDAILKDFIQKNPLHFSFPCVVDFYILFNIRLTSMK